jgi:hypothetical protein
LKVTILFLLGLLFLYAGFASYSELRLIRLLRAPISAEEPLEYDGHLFHSPTEKKIYEEDVKRARLYPWAHLLEEWQALLILSAAAGFLGGWTRFFVEFLSKSSVSHPNSPFIGLLLGPCLLIFSAIFDALMLEGESSFRLESVVLVCLAAGIAWESAWKFITAMAKKKFDG